MKGTSEAYSEKIKMTSKKVENQRRKLISALEGLTHIAELLDPVLAGESHKNGMAYRALDPRSKRGHIFHHICGGFDVEYVDEKGQKYVFKFYPKND